MLIRKSQKCCKKCLCDENVTKCNEILRFGGDSLVGEWWFVVGVGWVWSGLGLVWGSVGGGFELGGLSGIRPIGEYGLCEGSFKQCAVLYIASDADVNHRSANIYIYYINVPYVSSTEVSYHLFSVKSA